MNQNINIVERYFRGIIALLIAVISFLDISVSIYLLKGQLEVIVSVIFIFISLLLLISAFSGHSYIYQFITNKYPKEVLDEFKKWNWGTGFINTLYTLININFGFGLFLIIFSVLFDLDLN